MVMNPAAPEKPPATIVSRTAVRLFLLTFPLLWRLTAVAANSGDLVQRLHDAIRLPTINVEINYRFSPAEGLDAIDEPDDPAGAAEALVEGMKGVPADAEQWEKVSKLRGLAGDEKGSSEARKNAVRLYRERVSAAPDAIEPMSALALSLPPSAAEEAETIARGLVARAPEAVLPRLTLGQVLFDRESAALSIAWSNSAAGNSAAASAEFSEIEKLAIEARRQFDLAVEQGPKAMQPRLKRALFTFFDVGFIAQDPGHRGVKSMDEFTLEALKAQVVPDLREAARLNPEDYRLPAMRLYVQAMIANRPAPPDSLRDDLVAGIGELRRRAETAKSPTAAAAMLEVAGIVQYLGLHDAAGAEESAKHALQLDSNRARTWKLRLSLMMEAKRLDDIAAALEARLKTTNTVEILLMTAKVAFMQKKAALAGAQIDSAERLGPSNPVVAAFRSAYSVFTAAALGEWDAASRDIQKAMERVNEMEPSEQRALLAANVWANGAALEALKGNLPEARRLIAEAKSAIPSSDYVAEIQSIIGD
jgi:hypothetical protein